MECSTFLSIDLNLLTTNIQFSMCRGTQICNFWPWVYSFPFIGAHWSEVMECYMMFQLPGQLSATSTSTSTATALPSLPAELHASAPVSLDVAIQRHQLLTSQPQPAASVAQSQIMMPNGTSTPNMANARPPSAGGKQLPLSQKSQQVMELEFMLLFELKWWRAKLMWWGRYLSGCVACEGKVWVSFCVVLI